MTLEVFKKIMDPLSTMSAYDVMQREENLRGYKCIQPGQVTWLPVEDWPDDVIVSIRAKNIRIVAIYARNPGLGAFSRLIDAILAAGFHPIVSEPCFKMNEILRRWGWEYRIRGTTFETREVIAYPGEKWKRKRLEGK